MDKEKVYIATVYLWEGEGEYSWESVIGAFSTPKAAEEYLDKVYADPGKYIIGYEENVDTIFSMDIYESVLDEPTSYRMVAFSNWDDEWVESFK